MVAKTSVFSVFVGILAVMGQLKQFCNAVCWHVVISRAIFLLRTDCFCAFFHWICVKLGIESCAHCFSCPLVWMLMIFCDVLCDNCIFSYMAAFEKIVF